jgi:hypothetical protein
MEGYYRHTEGNAACLEENSTANHLKALGESVELGSADREAICGADNGHLNGSIKHNDRRSTLGNVLGC